MAAPAAIPFPKSPLKRLLLVGVLLLSVGLRLHGLRWGLPTAERFTTLYIDEYTPIHVLSGMHPGRLDFNPHYFTDPTFFYYQLGAVYQLAAAAGYLTLSGSQAFYLAHPDLYARIYLTGRLLVVLYALAMTALLFFIGRRIDASPAGGFLAAFFYAVIPLAALSAHVIDVGVPVSFWLGMTFITLLKALQTRDKKWLFWGALCAGLSCSTKYTAAPVALLVMYAAWKHKTAAGWAGAAALGLAGFVIGTPYALLDIHHFLQEFGVAWRLSGGHSGTVPLSFYLSPGYDYAYSVGIPLTLLAFAGCVMRLRERDDAAILALLFLVPYLFLLAKSNSHITRYLNETLAFLLPFAGVPLLTLWRKPAPAFKAAAALLFLLSLWKVPYTLAINHSLSSEKDPRDQSSDWIRAHIPAGRTIGIEGEANFLMPGHLYMQYWKGSRYPKESVAPPDYRVTPWDDARSRWPDPRMTTWVQSDLMYTGLGRKNPDLIARMRQTHDRMAQGFQPLARFERSVRWGPFQYTLPPHTGLEWAIFFPQITVHGKNQ